MRLGRRNEAPCEQHFHGLLGVHVAHQRHTGRGTKQTHVDAIDTEGGTVHRHRQITLRHQLATRCGGQALHAGDHRHRQLLNAQHHASALSKQLLVIGQFGLCPHFFQVMPGTKSLACSPQHHHTGLLVLRDGIQGFLQSGQHRLAQGVEAARVVQRQAVHTTRIVLVQQQIVSIGSV